MKQLIRTATIAFLLLFLTSCSLTPISFRGAIPSCDDDDIECCSLGKTIALNQKEIALQEEGKNEE